MLRNTFNPESPWCDLELFHTLSLLPSDDRTADQGKPKPHHCRHIKVETGQKEQDPIDKGRGI